MKKLIERLRQYSESLVAYKLGADFADAVCSAADAIENLKKQNNAQQDIIEKLKISLEQTQDERDAMKNELCYMCGNYREAHNGACDGCRWRKDAQ